MAEKSTIARPYAEAIFSLANEQGKLKEWSESLSELSKVVAHEDIKKLITNTSVIKSQVAEIIIDVCAKQLVDQVHNLVKLLAENRRLTVLSEIVEQFEALKSEAEKTITAEVFAAFKVSDTQLKQIATKLKARLGREVSLTCTIDESLVGGAIIKAGDLVIDGSTSNQIQKLAIELAR